jgi:hypothetical protein
VSIVWEGYVCVGVGVGVDGRLLCVGGWVWVGVGGSVGM